MRLTPCPIAFLMGPSYYFLKVLQPPQMGCIGIVLLMQSTLAHRLQWTMLPSPGLEEPSG